MSMINVVGWFRGALAEHAVNLTTNGFPQFTGKLQATEQYSFETKEWGPADAEACEITAFLTLLNKENEPIFHAKDVMRVFEWDGRSFAELDQADLAGTCVQWEVISSEYNGETRLKVARIANFDDVPGTGMVKKLDEAEIKGIDAKFASALSKLGGGPKPVSAKAPATTETKKGKKMAAKPTPLPAKPKDEPQSAVGADPTNGGEDAQTSQNPPASSGTAKPLSMPKPPSLRPTAPKVTELTYEQAWEKCCTMKAKTVTDDQLAQAFCKAVQRLCPDKEEGEINGEEWGMIADTVVAEYGVY